MSAETHAQQQLNAAKRVLEVMQEQHAAAIGSFNALMIQFAQAGIANAEAYANALSTAIDNIQRAQNRVTFAEALVEKRELEGGDVKP